VPTSTTQQNIVISNPAISRYVCMFWATGRYAADEGRPLAAELPAGIPRRSPRS
jgi:hypothetical protein